MPANRHIDVINEFSVMENVLELRPLCNILIISYRSRVLMECAHSRKEDPLQHCYFMILRVVRVNK